MHDSLSAGILSNMSYPQKLKVSNKLTHSISISRITHTIHPGLSMPHTHLDD